MNTLTNWKKRIRLSLMQKISLFFAEILNSSLKQPSVEKSLLISGGFGAVGKGVWVVIEGAVLVFMKCLVCHKRSFAFYLWQFDSLMAWFVKESMHAAGGLARRFPLVCWPLGGFGGRSASCRGQDWVRGGGFAFRAVTPWLKIWLKKG